jgi:hypothetical protein
MRLVNHTATQAEAELAWNEPEFLTGPLVPLRVCGNLIRDCLSVSGLDLRLFAAQIQPGFGQVVDQTTILQLAPDRTKKSIAGVFVVLCADVVDLSWQVCDRSLPGLPHRQVLLTTIPAKMSGIEMNAFVLSTGCEALRIEGDMASASCPQRG